MDEMQIEFEKRGWLIFRQPAQSPITNIHDIFIFPMLSKAVSRDQALIFGSTLLKDEELNATVLKVWNEKRIE